jgi:hypothetical protein
MKGWIVVGTLSWLLSLVSPSGAETFKSEGELREAVMEAMGSNSVISDIRPAEDSETSIESRIGNNRVVTDVGNLFDYLRAYPGENPAKWINQLIQSSIELNSHEVSAEALVPLVRTSGYVADTGMDMPQEKIVGDLVLSYAFEHSNGYAHAQRDELATLKLDSPRATAINNLARMLPRLSAEDEGGPIVLYSIDENFSLGPGLILLDAFWKHVQKRFPEGAIFINPRRDQVFLIDKRDPAAMDHARRLIDATFTDDYALQSRGIFDRVDGRLVLLEYH